jgi:hypothetical protein
MPDANPVTANEFIERELDTRLTAIEAAFNGHALGFSGPLWDGVDDLLRKTTERRVKKGAPNPRLVIILTTEGGYIETVQRMVDTVRRHYQIVDFVVPNYAYSAGTVFAMAGDSIWMDYYSRLGPIDPQIETHPGRSVSALGHLERYNALIKRAESGDITTAEVQLLIDGFDQAELYNYEQAVELSISLLEKWLVKYKFKNWNETETRKAPVTEQMKIDRASEVGRQLNDTKKWHSHGYGISMEVVRRDLRIKIDDYEQYADKCLAIREYHDLLIDYMGRRGSKGVIHILGDYRSFM